jgi:hypothetical protein
MKIRSAPRLTGFIITMIAASFVVSGQELSKLDFTVDLMGRHPEVFKNNKFGSWNSVNSVGPWYERKEGDAKKVVILNAQGDQLFAAQVDGANAVTRTATFDLSQLNLSLSSIRSLTEKKNFSESDVFAVRPVVIFLPSGQASVEWEVEVKKNSRIQSYRVKAGTFVKGPARIFTAPRSNPKQAPLPPPMADDMADNEIHHLAAFGLEAHAWVSGATTVQEKARRIFDRVHLMYIYDGTITNIGEFTWADYLARDANGRRGICDEWAVVQISYLRSVGIPARLKFLLWTQPNGERVGHAALEYADGGTWRHMDSLWQAFNNPARYRQSGATGVTVMDADYPLDSRYNGNAWGVPDRNGDGKLYPYGDFILNPAAPGNARPGYSY